MGLILTSCGLFKKKKPDDAQDFYTIKGTMYNADGITPLAGKSLNFTASGIGIQRKEIALLGSAITDVNGTFEMTYNYFDRTASNGISIDQPDEELPVYGPFLREIPVNTDISRDICLKPKLYLKYRFVVKSQKEIGDSLYMSGTRLPDGFSKIKEGIAIPLKDLNGAFESEILIKTSSAQYEPQLMGIYYTLTREDFYGGKRILVQIEAETFPIVNTLEIVID